MLKILGSICAEDYALLAMNQTLIDQPRNG